MQLETIVQVQQRSRPLSSRAISEILECDPCPPQDQLLAVVKALGGDTAMFRQLWNDIYAEPATSPLEPPVQRGACVGRFTSPQPDATVGTRIRVGGLVRDVPNRHHVWIAHQVDPGGLFWPKDFEVVLDGNGHFERYVYEGSGRRNLHLLLLLTSQAGHTQLTEWATECKRSRSYPGVPPSPDWYLELDRITVRHYPSSP
ncbi:hypothetical protein [Micromonospora sp. 4G55]|uniref:hypothetical protein n=1 Tax=Micromonospora sp. 4G55 TaxID=2806102 RepID=UPI001A537E86|nr:hypothetical protein [Micromonospora sp. 4G55]MBM0256000.1 hypothetical protein [Micromonospora sp. 4G55]